MSNLIDYYEILGIEFNASIEEIKKAYKKKAKEYHPDIARNLENSDELMKNINLAYMILSNETKRKEYDNKYMMIKHRDEFIKKKIQVLLSKVMNEYVDSFNETDKYIINIKILDLVSKKLIELIHYESNEMELFTNLATEIVESIEKEIPKKVRDNKTTFFEFNLELIRTIAEMLKK